VLKKARVVLVSDAPEAMVRAMHMIPAKTVQEGYRIARTLCGPQAQALVIPDGVSVIAQA
jgi:nickel-dependent lactate racemase